ncbi:hypothetical protein [Photorhabdus temperata]|uniref:Uncharacterized protein n=1 Tax=Photorhabdus temperata J3 TaxID=1389415 RepID=U7QYE0_PHOTE|nr:hypothetical protein [Photorhabdus temperata]ERT12072.1 hypothetical protein O185_16150 [Photorhabdus temperata J3]
MSDNKINTSKVSLVEFDHNSSPRVVVTLDPAGKYGIYWEKSTDDLAPNHSLVIYDILLAAMSNSDLRVSGTFETSTNQQLDGMIKTLTIKPKKD